MNSAEKDKLRYKVREVLALRPQHALSPKQVLFRVAMEVDFAVHEEAVKDELELLKGFGQVQTVGDFSFDYYKITSQGVIAHEKSPNPN